MKQSMTRFLLAACAVFQLVSAQAAPVETGPLSLPQGFAFRDDATASFGYITSLKIGGQALSADITASPGGTPTSVVAVLQSASWGGGVGDPLSFVGNVSIGNKQKLASLLHKALPNSAVEFSFVVYSFDPSTRNWFTSFSSAGTTPLQGILAKTGNDLQLQLDSGPGGEVQNPANWAMMLGIAPGSTAQRVSLSTGPGKNLTKAWGISQR